MNSPAIPVAPFPDLTPFNRCLDGDGLVGALRFLNGRTPHRFTGVYRFDQSMLRNVALVDKWNLSVTRGEDVPLAEAFCAHLYVVGGSIKVVDGGRDPRTPWMRDGSNVSYSGATILDEAGQRWGSLCHFDPAPCEGNQSDMAWLQSAASLIFKASQGQG